MTKKKIQHTIRRVEGGEKRKREREKLIDLLVREQTCEAEKTRNVQE